MAQIHNNGKYLIPYPEHAIGRGSFSIVHKAINTLNNEQVALKIIKQVQGQSNQKQLQLQIMVELLHQNIVPLSDFYFQKNIEDDTELVLVMPVAECSLNKLIQDKRNLYQVVFFAIQIAQGLKYLHQNKIAHLDLKPQNILVFQKKKQLKITDFGISRIINEETEITSSTSILGSKNYRSPQREKQLIKSRCVDVWAFGFILIQLCTSNRISIILQKNRIHKYQIKSLKDYTIQEEYKKIVPIIDKCLWYFRKRPSISQILQDLYEIIHQNEPAFLILTQEIQKNPNNAIYYYQRAKKYKEKKKYLFAERDYCLAIKKKPDFSQAYNDLANIYFQQNQYEQAKKNYVTALKYNEKFIDVYFNLGVLYQRLNSQQQAEKNYLEVLKYDQNHISAHHNLSILYQKQQNYLSAIQHYEKMIKVSPADYKILFNIAVLYQKSNKPQQAEKYYNQAILLNNKFREAYLNRGCIYKKKNKLKEAKADFTKAIQMNSKLANAYTNLGIILQEEGNHIEAIKNLDKALELQPNNITCYYNRAFIYQLEYDKCHQSKKAEILQKSIQDYSRVIKLQKQFTLAYNNRGIMYLKMNQYDKAIQDFTQAIRLKPQKRYYGHRAVAYYKKNDIANAEKDYQQSQQINLS